MKKISLFFITTILVAGLSFNYFFYKVDAESKYSDEFYDAYNFAYKNGITTMSNIDKAKMNSSLTRIAMAKMLSNYAINVLGMKPDTSSVPNFKDVSQKLDEQYGGAVTLAYQLGIMGINMKNNEFRPNDTVTRAEFGTALSRMLYEVPDGNPYYATHLYKLKREGIITNTKSNLEEKRGYVMVMLMRSQNNGIMDSNIPQNNESYKVTNDENNLTQNEVKRIIKKDETSPKGNIIYGKNGEQMIEGANVVYINTGYGISFTLSGDELSGGLLHEHDYEEYDELIGGPRNEHIILFKGYDTTGYYSEHRRIFFWIASLPNDQFDKLMETPEGKYERESGKVGKNNRYTFTMWPVNELHISNGQVFDLED